MWFNLVLPGLQKLGCVVPLGGTSNHFRTAALCALGGWDAYNVTEDCDLGLRMARCRLKTVVLDSTTSEEATSRLQTWLRQRSRWIKGYMQTYLVHMRHPLTTLREARFKEFFSLQVILGASVCMLFVNPLMWLLLLIYLCAGPAVIEVYHRLFPGPILYLAVICFFAGNIYYVYLYLLGCVKRGYYQLLPWVLLVPCYWFLSYAAVAIALYELIYKPHYWQKTIHGFHLKGKGALAEQKKACLSHKTRTAPGRYTQAHLRRASPLKRWVPGTPGATSAIPSVMNTLFAMPTQPLPAFSSAQIQARRQVQRLAVLDIWRLITLLTASLASVLACVYYFTRHQILIYSDAYSHLRIARSVLDSATPGFAQLGSVWLPLPHLLMLPLVWNDYLWRSGLAGALVSMACYIVTAWLLYLSAYRLTKNRPASYLGSLIFMLNPNILYLQTTPLSEPVSICATTLACYCLLAWAQDRRLWLLLAAALGAFLATMARYDGWALYMGMLGLVGVISWRRGDSWVHIRGNLVLFAILGRVGIGIWLLWNNMLTGDPLFFQRGAFSTQAQYQTLSQQGISFTYHQIWMTLKTYVFNVIDMTGPVLLPIAGLALVSYCIQQRLSPAAIALLGFAIPFAFYLLALYNGQAIIVIPEIAPAHTNPLYNVRYGAGAIPAIALLSALFLAQCTFFLRRWPNAYLVGRWLLAAGLIAQLCALYLIPNISLQDGLVGISCEEMHPVNAYLAQHYHGGRILQDVTAGDFSFASEAGIEFKDVVYDGSAQLWKRSLIHPERYITWVIDNKYVSMAQRHAYLNTNSSTFLSHFTLVFAESTGQRLYLRKGVPVLPVRAAPTTVFAGHQACSLDRSHGY